MVLRGLSIYRRFRRYKLEFNQNSMAGISSRSSTASPQPTAALQVAVH